ncbi:MAG: outer membrane lipid asymmetry maintenance protein MlaD [Planctomycetota bacterium]|jgi:phospholipid/cholesterol/gamma-HCH transport system substrate-binding protein
MGRIAVRNTVVGVFVLAGLAAMAYMSLSIGGLSIQGPSDFRLFAHFDETGGLKARAPVVISGVRVGEVIGIGLDEDYRARVELAVREDLELPADTSASIMTNGILGDRYVLLQLGGDVQYLASGDELSFTESALLLERMIGKLIHNADVGDD